MRYIILLLLVIMPLLYAEGFSPLILVHTQNGLIHIVDVQCNDFAIIKNENQLSSYCITSTASKTVDKYIKLFIKDAVLSVSTDQMFYVMNKGWVCANELLLSDLLLCEDKKFVELNAIEIINEKQEMHTLAVAESHIFCVTKYGIIVHNTEPIGTSVGTIMLPICPPIGSAILIGEVIALGVAGVTAYVIHKKSKHNDKHNGRVNDTTPNVCSCGGKPPKHEDDEDEHPNGIYEEVDYHHANSSGGKSVSPKNGQRALDNSLEIQGSDRHRIAVDEGEFVVLYRTSARRFHGHIREWDKLDQYMRNTLTKNKLVTHTGKIIKKA